MDNVLKIEKTKPLKVDLGIKIKSFLKSKKIIKSAKQIDADASNKDFKETLLIDEVLEAEENE